MALQSRVVRISENGELRLPDDIQRRLGVKAGDVVTLVETAEGFLVTSTEANVLRSLDRMGDAIRDKNVSLEEMIESGRHERAAIIREQYGLDPDAGPA